MPSDWLNFTWGDLATLEYGKGLRQYEDGEYPVFGTNGQIGWHTEPLWPYPGVIIGRKGAYRGVHYSKTPFFVIDTAFYLKPKIDFDTRWAYYQLRSFDVNKIDSGSAIPSTSRDAFYAIPVKYPPLPVQRKIVDVLSAYDDLIEVNAQRIRILEQMAQSIYSEWFGKVDVKSLPRGWKIAKVGDVSNVGRGSSPRPIVDQKYFEGGTIPWIKIADATKSGKYLYETKEHVNEYGASFSRLLPEGSLILAASGTLGYTQLLGVDGCVHDGWLYINEFDGVVRDYLYYLFRSKQIFFNNSAYGAAIQNINTTILREMEIILPPFELQQNFSKFISEIDNLLQNIDRSNANLRRTRDLLLPRLVSGEIAVSAVHE